MEWSRLESRHGHFLVTNIRHGFDAVMHFSLQETDRNSMESIADRKHAVADGISNGSANGPFRNDFTSPVHRERKLALGS